LVCLANMFSRCLPVCLYLSLWLAAMIRHAMVHAICLMISQQVLDFDSDVSAIFIFIYTCRQAAYANGPQSPFTMTCYRLSRPRVPHEHFFSSIIVSIIAPRGEVTDNMPLWTIKLVYYALFGKRWRPDHNLLCQCNVSQFFINSVLPPIVWGKACNQICHVSL
jgi:hypothetical protein